MVTLKDISKETGVSLTQVSRALGGFSDVNEQTRERVREAAQRLGYRPNSIAKGLKTGQTGFVAMVIPSDIDASGREIMFDMVVGISQAISRHGLKFLLHVVDSNADVTGAFDELYYGGGIDGFILTELEEPDPRVSYLKERKIPFVVHGQDAVAEHFFVDLDNFRVGEALAGRLLDAGHRRILFLNGNDHRIYSSTRTAGARRALTDRGIAPETIHVSYGPMTRARGREAAVEWLRSDEPPTAIIAGNMMLARGVYDAAAELGLSIPSDLSLVAHDDVLIQYPAEGFDPSLCVTRSSLSEAWSSLATLMSRAIAPESPEIEHVLMRPELVEGASVAEPSGSASAR
ncbi:LacI family DNA-binding transcriptional regulator [Tropicimonas sp. IMCC34043]|uniref:LacI family DNA-binding transcriptional regulator n=1 Tax=Tropicimonas sp. IMCC34043 TaxID=2248760 RepID=UPI0018E4EBE5|nr:LacI family DNA-binding transcriptional regulator [Tropicimonas sp. IMCC34043]